jgi:hypothetical protein
MGADTVTQGAPPSRVVGSAQQIHDALNNVLYIQGNAGNAVAVLPAAGVLPLTGQTTATSATGGAATALPAAPVGYLEVSINGTVRKIPYYAL